VPVGNEVGKSRRERRDATRSCLFFEDLFRSLVGVGIENFDLHTYSYDSLLSTVCS
jgi:hypothetical protein